MGVCMRAGVLHGFGDLRIDEVADPRWGPHDVVVSVISVQLSVTECALIAGEDVYGRESVGLLLEREGPQQLFGHEFCGVVHAVGEEVTTVALGDFVTSIEIIPCGDCRACRRGFEYECPTYHVLGFHRPGALAESLVVPESAVVKLPAELDIVSATALQPLSSAVLCHTVARVRPGESVAFIGGGVMGQLGVQVARVGNAGLVALTTRDARKLALARRNGADLVVPADADPVGAVHRATHGVGADVVFETAGGPSVLGLAGTSTLFQAVEMVRRGGRIVEVGVLPKVGEVPLGAMREKYVTFINPPSGIRHHSPSAHTLEYAIALAVSGRVDLRCLVTHRLEGLEATAQAVEVTTNKSSHGALGPAQILVAAPPQP